MLLNVAVPLICQNEEANDIPTVLEQYICGLNAFFPLMDSTNLSLEIDVERIQTSMKEK
jgi:hypothetical protein